MSSLATLCLDGSFMPEEVVKMDLVALPRFSGSRASTHSPHTYLQRGAERKIVRSKHYRWNGLLARVQCWNLLLKLRLHNQKSKRSRRSSRKNRS